MAVSRKKSIKYKKVPKTVTRGGKRVETHVWVLKSKYKKGKKKK